MNGSSPTPASSDAKPLPALRYKDDVALWPAKDGDKALLTGHVTINNEKVRVRVFLNDHDKEGNVLAHPYLSATTNTAADGAPPVWKTVAYGNAVNNRKDGKDVYFDQVIFNLAGEEKTFNAYVGKGCSEELHKLLGFTSPQIQRPAKEVKDAPAAEDAVQDALAPSM